MAGNGGSGRGFLGNVGGRVADRIAWGTNRDPRTGRVYATPAQIAGGVGSRILNTFVPGLGTVLNVVGNRYYNRRNPGFVDPQSVGGVSPLEVDPGIGGVTVGRPESAGTGTANLGFGGGAPTGMAPGGVYRDPYRGWTSYLAPQGSIYNFGNNNIRTQPTLETWQPQSDWGRQVMNGGGGVAPSYGAGAGAGRSFGNTHFSSGRGGAQSVDSGAAGDIVSWLGGGGSMQTTPFARAVK